MALPHRLPLHVVTKSVTSRRSIEAELGTVILDASSSLLHDCFASSPDAFSGREHELLSWYGELQYKSRGSGRCSSCRCSVRHALKVRAERTDGSTRTYVCLCTRCMAAEEAESHRILLMVEGRWLEYRAHATRQNGDATSEQAA